MQSFVFQGVNSYTLRANRDAAMLERPRYHFEAYQEMIKEVNKQLKAVSSEQLIMAAFEGPSVPSQIEIVITNRMMVSNYALTELSVVEALRSLKIDSFLIVGVLCFTRERCTEEISLSLRVHILHECQRTRRPITNFCLQVYSELFNK